MQHCLGSLVSYLASHEIDVERHSLNPNSLAHYSIIINFPGPTPPSPPQCSSALHIAANRRTLIRRKYAQP